MTHLAISPNNFGELVGEVASYLLLRRYLMIHFGDLREVGIHSSENVDVSGYRLVARSDEVFADVVRKDSHFTRFEAV